uniref:Uncharacterized protein n=1 Tax=Oryza brachyantha TaxID=4533 RepID=J3KVX6_ORYBR
MAEELWFRLGHSRSLAHEPFPEVIKPERLHYLHSKWQNSIEYLEESKIVLTMQINGKSRGTILIDKECYEDDAF